MSYVLVLLDVPFEFTFQFEWLDTSKTMNMTDLYLNSYFIDQQIKEFKKKIYHFWKKMIDWLSWIILEHEHEQR